MNATNAVTDMRPDHVITYRISGDRNAPERHINVFASPDELQQMLAEGYLVRRNLIAPPLLQTLREALMDVSEREANAGNGAGSGGTFDGQFLRHLFYKHETFGDVLNYRPIVSVAQALLGPLVQARLSARITFPGTPHQQTVWHYHQRNIPDPLPPLMVFPHSIDCLVYLDDLTESNGALGVVPRSHLRKGDELPDNDTSDRADEMIVTLNAGDGVFIHNNLWHRGRPSRSAGGLRRMLAFTYSSAWLKNVNDGRPPDDDRLIQKLVAEGDEQTRALLGKADY